VLDDGYGGGSNGGGGGATNGGPRGGGTYDAKNIEFGRMMLAVSEGQILGPVDGLKSIYLNDTAIQNADDSFNISAVSVALSSGTNTQGIIPGFPAVESEVSVNVEVAYGAPVTQTISTSGLSAVRVRMAVPQLKVISQTDGKESGSSVQFKIERQRTGYNAGAYEEVTLDQSGWIRGKFGSKFTKSFRIELPDEGTGSWTIRVTRLTVDAPDAYTINETWWDSYTELTDGKFSYPNTSCLAVMVDAKQFQSLPQVSTLMDLKIVNVPTNYTPAVQDPDTGVWTAAVYATVGPGTTGGIWDGTFTARFTRNPVWQFLDLATNTRYGGGTYLAQADIDVDQLYILSQLCDEFVDDGSGSNEPRYFCDIYIQSQEEAIKVLDNFASAFRGLLYWSGGKVTAVMDKDDDPVSIFTAANVKDGKFIYQGSGRKARHTAAIVTWNDPAAGYRQATEYVESASGIARYGFNLAKVAGFGISSQGLAQRFGLWTVLSDMLSPETVTFTAGAQGAVLRAGDVIQVMDPHRAGLSRFGGRVVSATTTAVTIDQAVTLGGGTYYLKCQLPNGTLETKTISNAAGSHTVINVTVAFSAAPQDVWIIQSGATEVLFRVLSVRETDPLQYEVTALAHDPTKYALVDAGATLIDAGGPGTISFKPVTSLNASETLRIQSTGLIVVLTASWLPPSIVAGNPNPVRYVAEASRAYGPWIPMVVNANTAELPEVEPDAYRVRVFAVYPTGTSTEVVDTYTVLGKVAPPADVTGFVATVQGDVLATTWDAVADVDLAYYTIRVPGAGATDAIKWAAGTAVTGCEKLSVTFATLVRPATGSYDYWIKAVDTSGTESANPTKLTIAVNALDDYVTPSEKRMWKAERDAIYAGQGDLDTQADAVSVSRVAYDNAISALGTYLETFTGAQGWTGGATDDWTAYTADYYLGNATPATTGAVMFSKFKDVWTARDALITAIMAATGTPFVPTDTFRPALIWDFGDGSDASFTIAGGSAADSATPMAKVSRKLTWSSGTMTALSPDFSSYGITGKEGRVILARIKYNSGTWVGKCHFKGLSPSITTGTADKWAQITAPPTGQWTDVAWDMTLLNDSSTSYIANTRIDQILLDLVSSAGNVEIDHVSIGTYGAGSKMDRDNALYQGVLDALATGNVALLGSTVISNGGNLIPNPKSELTSTTLPAGSYGLVNIDSTGVGYNGSTGCRKVLAGATAQITARTECKPNEVYYVSAQAKVSGAATAALQVETFDKDGVSQGNVTLTSGYSTTSTSYTLIYGQATIPANAVAMCVKLNCTSGTHALFDELGCLRAADAALLVNGSVTALVIAASAIQTYHLSVGPNYQFTATSGGSPLLMNNDGTFSANTVSGATENSVDAASYMDGARLYPATKSKTYEANFLSAGGQDRGFLINMSSAFGTVSTGLRILHSGSAITVKPVTGTRTYGTTITPTTTPASVPAAGTGKLTAVWAGDSGTSCSRRLVIKCDGVEVQTYSDAAIAAVSAGDDGQQSGYAGIILGTHATRPGDVKVWGIALGIGSVTIQDGVVTANTLETDLAIANTVRSSNYVAGSAGTSPTGFKLTGATFTTTYKNGTTGNCQFELGDGANIAGYKALTLADRAMFQFNRLGNSAFAYALTPWGTNGTEPPVWSSETKTAGTGSAVQSASGTVLSTPVESTGSVFQPFTVPPLAAGTVVTLTMETGRYSSSGANASYDAYVKAYLMNTATGSESLLATYTYATWTTAEALAWTARSEDISTEIGTAGGDFVLRLELYTYAIRTGGAGTKTASVYVDEVEIVI
jgi:predicted phage tail protein